MALIKAGQLNTLKPCWPKFAWDTKRKVLLFEWVKKLNRVRHQVQLGVVNNSVEWVSDYRKSFVGAVHADLVRPAGNRLSLKKSCGVLL
jgi:hypothetical protein